MDFSKKWTKFAVDAEVEHMGTSRLVTEHNKLADKYASLQAIIREAIELMDMDMEGNFGENHSPMTTVQVLEYGLKRYGEES